MLTHAKVSSSMRLVVFISFAWLGLLVPPGTLVAEDDLRLDFDFSVPEESLRDTDTFEVPPVGGDEIGYYADYYTYRVDVSPRDWELVAGAYEQCLAYRYHKKFVRRMESKDAQSKLTLNFDTMKRVPASAKGRKAAYNHSWSWRGWLTVTFGLKHRDKAKLSVPGASSRIVDGIETSVVEQHFHVIMLWDARTKRLEITTDPVNLADDAPFPPDPSLPWLSVAQLPLTLKLKSLVGNSSVAETISGGFSWPKLNFGTSYNYNVSKNSWETEVQLGRCVAADFVRLRVTRVYMAGETWYSIRFENGFNPYVLASFDESIAAVTEQDCTYRKSFDAEVEVKDKTGKIEVTSETASKCVGSGQTATASVLAEFSTNFGDGIAADHVITVGRKSANKSVSWSRPEFATDLDYFAIAAISGLEVPPIIVSSAGTQPKLPRKKMYRREF